MTRLNYVLGQFESWEHCKQVIIKLLPEIRQEAPRHPQPNDEFMNCKLSEIFLKNELDELGIK